MANMVANGMLLTATLSSTAAGIFYFGDSAAFANAEVAEEGPGAKEDHAENEVPAEPFSVRVYLSDDSQRALGENCKPLYEHVEGKQVTLQYLPSQDEYSKVHKLVGGDLDVEVLAELSDNDTQILYCRIVHPKQKAIEGASSIYPHVVLSSRQTPNPNTVNLIMKRLEARGVLGIVRSAKSFRWSGVLPIWKDGQGILHPATRMSVDCKRFTLKGALCTSRRWNSEKGECNPAPECGFCKFMKGGPCKEPFVAWEACIDQCNDDEEDIVEGCSEETLLLKSCIDANPEYYGVLSGEGEGEGEDLEREKSDS